MSFRPRSASLIIRRVEPGPGHHLEVLAVHPAQIERAAPTVQADLDGLLDRGQDPRGWWPAGWRCRPGGWRRRRSRRPGRRGSAARCRRRPTRTRGRPSATAFLAAALGALRLLGTSYQMGSTPAWASTERSSSSPPPILFFAWATTATVIARPPNPVRSMLWSRPVLPGNEDATPTTRSGWRRPPSGQGGRAQQQPCEDVGGEVHAPVDPGERHGQHRDGGQRPGE